MEKLNNEILNMFINGFKRDREVDKDIFLKIQNKLSLDRCQIEYFIENNINILVEKIKSSGENEKQMRSIDNLYRCTKLIVNILNFYDVKEEVMRIMIDTYIEIKRIIKHKYTDDLPVNATAYLVYKLNNEKDKSDAMEVLVNYTRFNNPFEVLNKLYYDYKCYDIVFKLIKNRRYARIDTLMSENKFSLYTNYRELRNYALKGHRRYYEYCRFFISYLNDEDVDYLLKYLDKYNFSEIEDLYTSYDVSESILNKLEHFEVASKLFKA